MTLGTEQLSQQLEEAPGLQGGGVCAQVRVGCLRHQNSSVTLFCLRSSFEKEWEWRDWRGGGGCSDERLYPDVDAPSLSGTRPPVPPPHLEKSCFIFSLAPLAWLGQRGINGVPIQPAPAGWCDAGVSRKQPGNCGLTVFLSHSLYKRAFYTVCFSSH